jgi:hypothetical protein
VWDLNLYLIHCLIKSISSYAESEGVQI